MNFLHLRAFHAVATHGSFTRAAAALNVTQPTISDQIKALEPEPASLADLRRPHPPQTADEAQKLGARELLIKIGAIADEADALLGLERFFDRVDAANLDAPP